MTTRPKPPREIRNSTDGYAREPKYQEQGGGILPGHNHNGHKVTRGITPEGESGRRGFHPLHFFKVCWTSSCAASRYVNVLWPFVIAAIALHFAAPHHYVWVFALSYVGMVPSANLIGFAGQELARKLPKVFGVILETTLGSLVEIILFMVLLRTRGDDGVSIIRAAILGSILANLLLCMGLCFFVGGLFREDQNFHDAVSDIGSNLMLVAGMALVIPVTYATALADRSDIISADELTRRVLHISRATAIVLLIAYCVYVFFQMRSHHGLYDDILEGDEQRDADRHKDLAKAKLTFTEAVVALALAITFVAMMAVFLVQNIEPLVEHHGVPDAFIGLILVPLVEKAAEHLTAIDEAWDDQMNFALVHVLGASVQTALLNTPLVVLVGWGLGVQMSLEFELFDAVVLILAIIVVGGFLRDGKSNYLEGALCFFVYVLIAVAAFYYPNPLTPEGTASADEAAARIR